MSLPVTRTRHHLAWVERRCISVYHTGAQRRTNVKAVTGSDEQLGGLPPVQAYCPGLERCLAKTAVSTICDLDPTLDHALSVWLFRPPPHVTTAFHLQ